MAIIMLLSIIGIVAGAEILAKASEGLAASLKKTYVVGAVLLALSGNLPEMVVATSAVLQGRSELAVASIVGSVAVNVLVVLGLGALWGAWRKDLVFDQRKLQGDLPLLIGAVGFFVFVGFSASGEHHVNIIEAVLLLVTYVLLLRFMLVSHPHLYSSEEEVKPERSLAFYIVLFIAAAFITALSGHALVGEIDRILLREMGLDEALVGFTVLALAGNLPEHWAAIRAARKGRGEIAVGNAIGSASQAIYLILGLVALLAISIGRPLEVVLNVHNMGVMVTSVLFAIIVVGDGRLTWFEGWVALAIYALAAASL